MQCSTVCASRASTACGLRLPAPSPQALPSLACTPPAAGGVAKCAVYASSTLGVLSHGPDGAAVEA